jgi:hypothetical protein
MIELELQALSLSREGLLIDIGRTVAACGFALVRHRLADDRHGVLLTMIVRGPERQQRALERAMDAHERIVSFEIAPYVAGLPKPHFAASRSVAIDYVPPPAPPPPAERAPAPASATVARADIDRSHALPARVSSLAAPEVPPPMPDEPMFLPDPVIASPPVSLPEPEEPFVEPVPLEADVAAVEKLLPALMDHYPRIFPLLDTLEQSVQEGARESTLWLAGQRIGAWVFERHPANAARLSVGEAMERIGVPALSALVEVMHAGDQLHIRNSPLCMEQGRSGCKFLGGYLEALLGAAIAPRSVSIFAVACRSCGAGECILAIMD